MTLDNAPAIKAFAKARIDYLRATPQTGDIKARLDELFMILALCDGLVSQADLVAARMLKKSESK